MKRKKGIASSPKYNFAGGLVTMAAKTRLRPSQLIRAKNINVLIDGEAEVRGGYAKVSTVAFGTTIDRFIHFKTETYDKIIGYGGAYIKRLDTGAPDVWTTLSSTMPDTDDFRSMVIANNMLYIASSTGVKKYYPGQTVLWDAGIVPPATAATPTADVAGLLSGVYTWYYTYYNSTTDEESNPSPMSAELTVDLKQVILSGFVASTDPQVDKIRIYRNPSGVTTYWRVGEKANTSDSFTDNVPDDNLGVQMDERNAVPPNSTILLWHMNRMFYVDYSDPSTLYYSEPYKPGSVYSTNSQGIEVGDGGKIVAIMSCYDNIVVFKNSGVYLFVFNAMDPLSSYYQPVATSYGCIAPMSVVNIREDIAFLSPEGLKRITNGGTTLNDFSVLIESEFGSRPINPIANILRSCFASTVSRAVGTFYEAKNQYHLSVPYYSSANNDLTFVWNDDAGAFTTHEGFYVKAAALYRYYDSELLYRSHNDQYIYKHDYGTADESSAIEFDIQTGWHDVNNVPDIKTIRLFFPTLFGAEDVVISYELLKDFESTGSGTGATVDHNGAAYWGVAHWGYAYWGASGEATYRKKIRVKGRIFSTRFYGTVDKKCGVAGYQFFYIPKGL